MTELTDLSETDADNILITGANVAEGCPPSGINNAIRNMAGLIRRAFKTSIFRLRDSTDQTKLLAFDLSGLSSGTRTLKVPDINGSLATVPRGHIFGLTLTNAADATNDIAVAAGEAASDDTAPTSMVLGTLIAKRLDASWAVGTGGGGRDTGSIANAVWYIWLIRRPDTGVVDALLSLSATSPTMPTNYTEKALIGEVTRAGGVNGVPVNYNRPAVRYAGAAPVFGVRAWGTFVGGPTPTLEGSGNVASITYNSVGSFTVAFTTAMPDAKYAVNVTPDRSSSLAFAPQVINKTTAGFTIRTYDASSFSNIDHVDFTVVG